MKVLKFGGSSVGSAESLANVKQIVEASEGPVVVVVSALGGVTDELLRISSLAASGDKGYADAFDALKARHYTVIEALGLNPERKAALLPQIDFLFEELGNVLLGMSLLKIMAGRISDNIISYGERLSSRIVTAAIDGAEFFDSLDYIRTVEPDGKSVPDFELTNALLKEALCDYCGTGRRIAVMPGFISRDRQSGAITNLGRGGSDYTASIIAAALDAEILEIWTDVDGFMTADPRVIKTSYVINELSYKEAMELCNFGAKVIYPPTLYPVRAKSIPIKVKNTFNPSAPGTIITENPTHSERTITGISSIGNTSIITLSGNSMVGIVGVDGRIFSKLADNHISVFLIAQSSSETGISLGVDDSVAELACKLLNEEFAAEIALGSINPVRVDRGLATVAVVGDNMRNKAGMAGKLFSILGRNGISVIACTQGSDETNISLVIRDCNLRKALNVIHDGFLLSEYQELNLFICGTGTVGGQLLEQMASQREKLMRERNLKLNVVGISRSRKALFNREGIDIANWKAEFEAGAIDIDIDRLKEEVTGMNIFNAVFVDCTASPNVAAIYKELFQHGVSVVTANKIAASSDYDNYRMLKDTARKYNVKFLFETNVGAGLPIINTINDLVGSGDRIQKIEAVLSGTLNFIFNTISEDIPLSQTVKMAQEQGFSEPDPRIDLSGKDVIRKLVILAREAGYKVNQEDVEANLFIPADFFNCSMEEFWQKLPSLDAEFEAQRKDLEARHRRWRFVAKMEDGKYSVSLRDVDQLHSFYVLDGSNNIVLLTTERYHEHPMLIQGYGAGASVTAAGVFADIMSIANI